MSRPDQQGLRRRVRIAQVLLALIVVTGTLYVTDAVVGGNVFRDPVRVTVELTGAGGLHDASTVTYRGQHVGEVETVRLTDDGVEAVLALDPGTEVPRDSLFVVANLSAIGEQYVDIRPRSAGGPWLEDGARVGPDETRLPVPTYQVLADAQRLMRRIDVRDLETVADETEQIFGDSRVDLRALARESERTFALLQELQPDLATTVREAERPLRTGVDLADELRRTSRDLQRITGEVDRSLPTLRRLLDRSDTLVPLLRSVWGDLAPTAVDLLARATPVAVMAQERLPGLHHWLDWVGLQTRAMIGSTRDGSGRVILVPRLLDNCTYTQDQRLPKDTTRRPTPTDRRCTDDNPRVQQRGAKNVPRP